MLTVFRLNSNNTVNIYRKLFSKTITRSEFAEKSIRVDFDEFIWSIKDSADLDALWLIMNRLKRIDKLTRVGPRIKIDENGKPMFDGFYVGKFFIKDYFTSEASAATVKKIGYRVYGNEMMNELIENGMFDTPDLESIENVEEFSLVKHYINGNEISKKDYDTLAAIIAGYTKLRDFNNPLDESESFVVSADKKKIK